MEDFIKEMVDNMHKKMEEKKKLEEKSCFVICRSEHSFQQVCEAMFQARVPKVMDCNIEVFYKSKEQIICVKLEKGHNNDMAKTRMATN